MEEELWKGGSADKCVNHSSYPSQFWSQKMNRPAVQAKTMPERHMTQPRQAQKHMTRFNQFWNVSPQNSETTTLLKMPTLKGFKGSYRIVTENSRDLVSWG